MRLDHVGIFANDLSAAAASYQRMGFRFGALARHRGPVPPTMEVATWGVANQCAILRSSYLEIAGIVAPDRYLNAFDEMLASHEGCHIVALVVPDPGAEALRLRSLGFSAPDPVNLSRPLGDGPDAPVLSFQLVRLSRREMPEARFVVMSHETLPLLKSSAPSEHANGASDLIEVIFGVTDLAEARQRFARLTGSSPAGDDPAATSFAIEGGRLTLVRQDRLAQWAPGADPSRCPFAAAIVVAVADIEPARAQLEANAITYQRRGADLVVAPQAAAGVVVILRTLQSHDGRSRHVHDAPYGSQ